MGLISLLVWFGLGYLALVLFKHFHPEEELSMFFKVVVVAFGTISLFIAGVLALIELIRET